MVLADRVALNVTIPTYDRPDPASTRPDESQRRRRERIDSIKEQFRKALRYDHVRSEAKARGDVPPKPDPRLDALVPYAKGEKPVIFRADRRMEILDALEVAKELGLKAIISGGLDAWKVADELKDADVPVIVAGTLRLSHEPTDPYDAPYANPAKLHEAGVRFAIRSIGLGPDQATSARNLPFEAGVAVAYGLPEEAAVKAVTLAPAEILGVADRLGSLEVGKQANLVITAGPLLQVTSQVKGLFIGGEPLKPESYHTRLYDKYRERLAEVRAGTAPLGLDRGDTKQTAGSSPRTNSRTPAAEPAGRR